MAVDNISVTTVKSTWVEPQVLSLDVAETAVYPNRGTDGNVHLDCTRS